MDPITCRNIEGEMNLVPVKVTPEVIKHSRNLELLKNEQYHNATKTSLALCDMEQPGYSLPLQTTSINNALQCLFQSCTEISSTLASPPVFTNNEQLTVMNNQCLPTPTSIHVPCSNATDYAMNNASTETLTSFNNTSSVWTESSETSLQADGPSKPHIQNSCEINACSFELSSRSDSQTNHAPDLSSSLLQQQTTLIQPSSCVTSNSNTSLFGPNEFNLTISLSPLDAASVENVEWIYVDGTGLQLTLNLNTSSLLEHLHNNSGMGNSTVRIRLPETRREYNIRLKGMEMTDVKTGEKIALYRKTWMPDDMQPLQ